jgi:hypothetical protein
MTHEVSRRIDEILGMENMMILGVRLDTGYSRLCRHDKHKRDIQPASHIQVPIAQA